MNSTGRRTATAKHAPVGRLWAEDGFSVPVSITHHPDHIMLLVLDGGPDFVQGPLTYLTLESASGRGVVRSPGAAELLGPNLLRFVLDDEPEVVQRREFVRVVVAKKVLLESAAGEFAAEAVTVDLSGGGMLVTLPRGTELPADEEMHFTLYLGRTEHTDTVRGTLVISDDPEDDVNGIATTVRRNPRDQVAFDFRSISRRNQERLIRYVFERQRVALAMTRGDAV